MVTNQLSVMKHTNKAKKHVGFFQTEVLEQPRKPSYYFHPDEDFREDPDWKPKIRSSSKSDRTTTKGISSR